MSDEENLSEEVKTYVTPSVYAELEAIAKARTNATGEKVRITVLLREAIRDLIAKHSG